MEPPSRPERKAGRQVQPRECPGAAERGGRSTATSRTTTGGRSGSGTTAAPSDYQALLDSSKHRATVQNLAIPCETL